MINKIKMFQKKQREKRARKKAEQTPMIEKIYQILKYLDEQENKKIDNNDDAIEAASELIDCENCPVNPGDGKCNCLQSMDGSYG